MALRVGRDKKRGGWRPLLLLGLPVVVLGLALAGPRFHRYVFAYDPHSWIPESRGPGRPTFYYVDWRGDWADEAHLRAAVADGVLRTPRARPRTLESAAFPRSPRIPQDWLPDPIGVVQGGLALHDQLLGNLGPEQRAERRAQLLAQSDWLHAAAVRLPDSSAVWPIPWAPHHLGIEPPWISSLAQGQAISLLVRTAALGRPEDLHLAEAAARSLRRGQDPLAPVDSLGVFFEEYPTLPRSSVLNGCLFAWLGLWDLARATGDPALRGQCLRELSEIERRVPRFELEGWNEGWTRYDLLQTRPTSPNYQEIHASLAEAIAAETGRPFWISRATAWRAVSRSKVRRSWVFLQVAWHELFARGVEVEPIPFEPGREPRPGSRK